MRIIWWMFPLACGGPADESPPPEPEATEAEEDATPAATDEEAARVPDDDAPAPVSVNPSTHFTGLLAVQGSLLTGDLDASADELATLASWEAPVGVPDTWLPYSEALVAAAKEAQATEDPRERARAVAKAVDACGSCHSVHVDGPIYPPSGLEETRPTLTGHMERNLWAFERMWEGLTSRWEDAWIAGADVLSSPEASDLAEHPDLPDEAKPLAEELLALGKEARARKSWTGRAEIYGELTGVCASCHQQLKAGP